ncbi:hypothetical protein GS909_10250 [Rhodococcus hoagii]|nr:hypothetical protein [Prescottella equi]
MTVLRADQTTGGTTGARPRGGADLCRLTILTPHSQIDLALPNSVPVELLVPGIADLVEKHSAANDFDVAGDRLHPTRWVLSRVAARRCHRPRPSRNTVSSTANSSSSTRWRPARHRHCSTTSCTTSRSPIPATHIPGHRGSRA